MFNLIYKGISVMKKQRESSNNQPTLAEKQNLIARLATAGVTHIEFTMLANDNADLISHGFTPSPKTIEAETQEWYDVVHAQPNVYGPSVYGGYLKVIDRCVFANQEGIVGWSVDTGTPIGTAASAPTDGNSTWLGRVYNYYKNHVTFTRLQTGDLMCPTPEITGPAFGTWWTNQSGAKTYCAEVKKLVDNLNSQLGITMAYVSNPNFSEVSSGFWDGYPAQGNVVCFDYYGNWNGVSPVTPAGYIADLNSIYAGQSLSGYGISTGGIRQFHMEWGDLSGSIQLGGLSQRTGDNFVTGSTPGIEVWLQYLIRFYKAYKDNLVDTNKLLGFSYWGGWEGQNTSLLWKTGSGASSQYFLNSRGQILAAFFKGNGINRIPVQTTGSYTEASPSFGGRNMSF